MAKILLVEDDELVRQAVGNHLTDKGHVVTTAADGKIAQVTFQSNEFDLVVSDIQMPNLNGVDLLKWIRERSKVPFILMTGFGSITETKTAYDLGASDFLAKPFASKDLTQLIEKLLAPKGSASAEEKSRESSEKQYCKVALSEFVANPHLEFDLFVQLGSTRYIKIANGGECLDVTRIKTYEEKGLRYLHVKKDDFGKVVKFNLHVTKSLAKLKGVDIEKKAHFMRNMGEMILEKCFVCGVDTQSFGEAKDFFTSSANVMADDSGMLDLMKVLDSHSDSLHAHSIGVAIYSILIAKKMGIETAQAQFNLCMAGLFHDIGKKEIDPQILEKSPNQLTPAEAEIMESHVERSCEIMRSISAVPSEVIQMIREHHQDEIGLGYPKKASKAKLHPHWRILHVANEFVTRALRNDIKCENTAQVAIDQMKLLEPGRLNENAFSALKSILTNTV